MHKLTEKLLETGVIPEQAVKLLKLWNSTFAELPDDIKQAKTQEELMQLVDEMAEIIENEEEVPELRETEFDLEDTRKDARHVTIEVDVGDVQKLSIAGFLGKTVGGRYVCFLPDRSPGPLDHAVAVRGNIINDSGVRYMVTSVEPRYVDEQLKYYVLSVEKMDA